MNERPRKQTYKPTRSMNTEDVRQTSGVAAAAAPKIAFNSIFLRVKRRRGACTGSTLNSVQTTVSDSYLQSLKSFNSSFDEDESNNSDLIENVDNESDDASDDVSMEDLAALESFAISSSSSNTSSRRADSARRTATALRRVTMNTSSVTVGNNTIDNNDLGAKLLYEMSPPRSCGLKRSSCTDSAEDCFYGSNDCKVSPLTSPTKRRRRLTLLPHESTVTPEQDAAEPEVVLKQTPLENEAAGPSSYSSPLKVFDISKLSAHSDQQQRKEDDDDDEDLMVNDCDEGAQDETEGDDDDFCMPDNSYRLCTASLPTTFK
jgi:hypothetical protein